MAGLLILLNRAASYFNKSNNDNTDCERSEVMLHDDSCKYLCSTCRWFVTIENYDFERERCNDCCSLTQDEEKRCVACNEFKHITLYEAHADVKCKQCANAWRKVKKHCDSCKCDVQWGSWRFHIKSKKHLRNMTS
jgi:hypothetical protein